MKEAINKKSPWLANADLDTKLFNYCLRSKFQYLMKILYNIYFMY